MAIIWADGFENWTSVTGEYDTSSGATIRATSGRRGLAAIELAATGGVLTKNLPASYSELYVSFAYNPNAFANAFFSLLNGATVQVQLQTNADGSITALRNTTALGSSAPGLVSLNVYTHFQIRVVLDDTVGVFQVRINGSTTPAINLTGVDTNNAGSNLANIVRLRNSVNSANLFDDLVIWDTSGSIANTWIGDTRVDSYWPNGNGDSSQFVGSDGNSTDNYLLVDGAAPNGTDYVQSSTVNDKDLYAAQNMTHTPTNIYGVLVTASALKDDAGTRSVRLLAKNGGTEVDNGADIALSTSRTRITGLFETDPNTSAAWTKSGWDSTQIGIKVTV